MLPHEALKEFLAEEIRTDGPMDIATFMDHVLSHPEYGYYRRQDPFGAQGDFITAPEVSQIFGEMVGAWVADIWNQIGSPAAFMLAEAGPGRGTLMADIMRAGGAARGFKEAARIHLIETSPALREKQGAALAAYNVNWHESPETLPRDIPLILIGNEFLDALPVHQLVKTVQGWDERVVELSGSGLYFGHRKAPQALIDLVPGDLPSVPPGNVFEVSPQRKAFIEEVCQRLKGQGGAALFIDYGEDKPEIGDSLHAIYQHERVPVLKNPGQADLSTNVDFGAVKRVAADSGAVVHGPATQARFLKALGVEVRASHLRGKANEKQAEDIETALQRLLHSDQMGNFKVIGLTYDAKLTPAGF